MTVINPKRRPTDAPAVNIKYICDACHADISSVIRIRCAECTEAVDCCLECFSEGAEIKPHHIPTHAYHVMEPFSYPIYDSKWRADEELLLIDGAMSMGLGNWLDISNYIGSKTPEECEQHYMDLYIHSDSFPYPSPDAVSASFPKRTLKVPHEGTDLSKFGDPEYNPLVSQPATHEIAGFMPMRMEFETELDQEAELVIRDLVFPPDEPATSMDHILKISLLQGYNDILDKRRERKQFIVDHNFLEFKKYLASEKQRSKEDKQIFSKISVYQRFMSAHDFDLFQKGFLEEANLVRRISKLQEYRRQGIRDFDTAAAYDRDLILVNSGNSHVETPKSQTIVTPLFTPIVSTPSTSRSRTPVADPIQITPVVRRSLGQPLDISDAEGVELLSSSERNICSILRIMPRVYLCIKETFIAEYHRNGYLKRAQARSLVKIDVNKTSKLYDFFIASGWILPRPKQDEPVQEEREE